MSMKTIRDMRFFPYARNVHRLVLFITENIDKLSHVKSCPECKMADFTTGTDYTKCWCKTCGAWTPLKELVTYTPPAYLRVLITLKLRFNGGDFGSFEPLTWNKCYNELDPIKLLLLDKETIKEKPLSSNKFNREEWEDKFANYYD